MFAVLRQRHRCLLGASVIAAMALVGAGCGSDDESSSEGDSSGSEASISPPADLINEGEFTVCTDPTYPPLESLDESGEYVGFDIGMAEGVAEKWGVEPAFQETAFAGILPALDAGRCDVAWSGLFVDPKRTETFGAVPYQETASVLMVQAGNPADISSPEDLAGKTVVSQNGSNLLKLANEISDQNEANGLEPSNVQGYDKFNEAIQQLIVGRADAVVTQDIDSAAREAQQPGQFEIAYTFDDAETFAAYYAADNTELGSKLYEALVQLQQEGELEAIAKENAMPTEGIAIDKPIQASEG